MTYGLDIEQLRARVIVPALASIGACSPAAANLVLGTALVESRAKYLHQLGGGPAIGIFQMEPETHTDIWGNFLVFRPSLAEAVDRLRFSGDRDPAEMAGNLFYATAMCRVHYLRVAEPLPALDDAPGMARYWKSYYNTPQGAGSVERALPHFRAAC